MNQEDIGPTVVALSGRIGSGKSSVTAELSRVLGIPSASFGAYVRHLTEYLGLNAGERTVLQEVGELMARHPDAFCKGFLRFYKYEAGQALIVDGVRHVEVLNSLQEQVSPARVILVYVASKDETIKERIRSRDRLDSATQHAILEQHSTEVQVVTHLSNVADLTILNSPEITVEKLAQQIIEHFYEMPNGTASSEK